MDYVDEDVQRDTTLQLADDEDQSKRSHRRQASMEEADGSITRSHRRQASVEEADSSITRSHRRQASVEEADGSITRSHRRQASWRKLTVASMAGISFTCLPDISEITQETGIMEEADGSINGWNKLYLST